MYIYTVVHIICSLVDTVFVLALCIYVFVVCGLCLLLMFDWLYWVRSHHQHSNGHMNYAMVRSTVRKRVSECANAMHNLF